ncbi:MAG: hypothetical protein ACKVP0_14275 [Pirellulaceae bacterium]
MSYLSRLLRNRKRRERTLTLAQRRRKLVVEPLEDRRMLAISTSFAAGVLTFTGDFGGVSHDKVILESTATPGTVNYDDGGGLGSTTQAGVNSVVFNGGGGANEMVVIDQGATIFRPSAGASFNIAFNVTDDVDPVVGPIDTRDSLRIAGGNAAAILSGSYTVSGPTSGTISYATTTTPINIAFSGLNSVLDNDEVSDETIQAGAFTTNSSTGAESAVVKVGPILTAVPSFTQGPVVIDGSDRDQHGSFSAGANQDGWQYIQQLVQFVHGQSFIQTNFPGANGILALGAKTAPFDNADAADAINSAAAVAGIPVTHVDGAAGIAAVNFNLYKMIYVPSNAVNTGGGITGPELDALILRKAEIQTYVRNGGGIVALTDADTEVAAMGGDFATRAFYGWLEIPAPFTILDAGAGGFVPNLPLRKTQAAIDAGLTISDAALSNGTPYHNTFTGPAGFNGLDVFVLDRGANGVVGPAADPLVFPAGDDRAVALGQGAVNQSVGGGPTTQISGNQMTLINLGNKPSLALNALGGTDSILVDGSVLSLDGLLAPLTVNGGGNGDSLSITDSADAIGDAVSVTSTGTTGLAAFPITYSGIGSLSVQATQGTDTMTVDVSPTAAGLTSVTVLGGLGGDLFTGPTLYMRPSSTIALTVHGGTGPATPGPGVAFNPFAEAGDKFNLDMTNKKDGAVVAPVTPVVIVDTNGGNAISANTQLVRFTGIEDIDVLDGGLLTNTAVGDFYLRGTDQADYIQFVSNGLADPVFRVRVGNVYYPPTGNFGPYTTGGANPSEMFIYGRRGNDTISMYNTRLNAVFFGEGGDDILTGGYGNDLLIGGSGNDRINGGVVGGNDEIWGDDFDPVVDGASIATRSLASQTGTGNDQINTFGGEDTIYGQGGADIMFSGGGADYLNGGPGDDQVDGQAGDDRVYGGTGNDVATGSDGNDVVAGNDGTDTLYGRLGNDILIGGIGQDIVNGNEGGDALVGDESNGAGSGSLAKGDAADAALLALLTLWGPTPTLASLGAFNSAAADGSVDTLWGGSEADAFFGFGALLDLAADRVVGPDLN